MDKKRLNAENVPTITKGDIEAWNRGKDDAARNKLLRATQKLSPKRAIALVKMYAELGDLHYLSTRFDISPDEARRILAAFDISSIEDAKASVRNGIIAEYDSAVEENRDASEQQRLIDHAAAQERLTALEKVDVKEKTEEEKDLALAKRRDEAQRKNKEDRLRQLIFEGLDPNLNTSTFRIPLSQIAKFKQMIPHGVSQLQRRFGGSAKDIVGEIQRLAPEFDRDMLRS